MRLVLINPTAPEWRVGPGGSPGHKTRVFRFSMLSSLSVAAAMPPNVETRIVDEEVEPVDLGVDADLVGLSFMTFNAPRAYEIADAFRSRGTPVIVGGYHPTFMPQEAKTHADAVCIGEAEANAPQMIADLSAGRLRPFYRNGLADLGRLRAPDRRLLRASAYAPADAVQATRGCSSQCTFCSIAPFFEHRFRARPVDQVIEELRPLRRLLLFMDDNITADVAYAKELFARMVPLRKRWFSQCGIGIADDDELLRLAYASGCRGLFIGLESISDENLKAWRKTANRAGDYSRAIAKLHATGIGVIAGIVFGNDADTRETFPRTLEFLHEARVDALQATILTPFPGTPLFDSFERDGRITDRDWAHYDFRHVVFEPRNMSPEKLRDGHDWVLSRFYSRRSVASRVLRAVRYLAPSTITAAMLPLNLSYRHRLGADGTLLGAPAAAW